MNATTKAARKQASKPSKAKPSKSERVVPRSNGAVCEGQCQARLCGAHFRKTEKSLLQHYVTSTLLTLRVCSNGFVVSSVEAQVTVFVLFMKRGIHGHALPHISAPLDNSLVALRTALITQLYESGHIIAPARCLQKLTQMRVCERIRSVKAVGDEEQSCSATPNSAIVATRTTLSSRYLSYTTSCGTTTRQVILIWDWLTINSLKGCANFSFLNEVGGGVN